MKNRVLILGDILALLLTTLIGFATHGEMDVSFLPRMTAAFFPLVLAWFSLAPLLGLFDPLATANSSQLWRPLVAMIFAAPFATVLRGLLLNAPILPIFALVFAATSAVGISLWRGVYVFMIRKRS